MQRQTAAMGQHCEGPNAATAVAGRGAEVALAAPARRGGGASNNLHGYKAPWSSPELQQRSLHELPHQLGEESETPLNFKPRLNPWDQNLKQILDQNWNQNQKQGKSGGCKIAARKGATKRSYLQRWHG